MQPYFGGRKAFSFSESNTRWLEECGGGVVCSKACWGAVALSGGWDVGLWVMRAQQEGPVAVWLRPWTALLAGLWRLSFVITVCDWKRRPWQSDGSAGDGWEAACRAGGPEGGRRVQRKEGGWEGGRERPPNTRSSSFTLARGVEICMNREQCK